MSHPPAGRSGWVPADSTPFVGRSSELARLADLLARVRMVTVTGPGGVGKTRMALHAAVQARPANLNSACAAGLSSVTDPSLVPHAVAARLGLAEQDVETARDAVLHYVRDRKLLLILDSCEHLLDACAELAESLLQETGGVTILATSRQPLDIVGEHVLPLTPLPVPEEPRDGGQPVSFCPGDAAALFAQAAARVVPGFAITRDNAGDVVRVCRRADGIPLVLELAAARLRTMSVAELAGQPSLLTGGTLDRAMRWSYGLCTSGEQVLWQRLSVFAGTISAEAAEEICSGPDLPREAVLESLVGLVDKSVLYREPGAESDEGPARFRQLDTIREFGARALDANGTGPATRQRLITRYLESARYFRDHFLDDDQLPRLSQLRREHASVQAALGYCLGGSSDDPFGQRKDLELAGAEMATALFGYWQAAGLQREGGHWLDRVLERFPGPGPERARALAVRCYLGTTAGHAAQAVADGRDCVRLAARLGDEQTSARGHLYLCHALTAAGDFDGALKAGAKAEPLLNGLGDGIGLRILTAHMAYAHQFAGNLAEADAWYERGVTLWGRTQERWSTGWLHLIGGYTYLQQGKLDECAAAWQVALRNKHAIGDVVGTGYVLEAFALLAVVQERWTRAAWLFGSADPLWERAGAVLSNDRRLVTLHADTRAQVRGALGPRKFGTLLRRGERCPLPAAVEAALADADADALPAVPAAARTLTAREDQVAELVIAGLSNREIAARMTVSKRTVDAHVEHIYTKLSVSSRVELARRMRR